MLENEFKAAARLSSGFGINDRESRAGLETDITIDTSTKGDRNAVILNDSAEEDSSEAMGSLFITPSEKEGFLGPSSNVMFVRTLMAAIFSGLPHTTEQVVYEETISDKDMDLNIDADQNEAIQPTILPTSARVIHLMDDYFQTVNSLYPFLNEQDLRDSYQTASDRKFQGVRRSWLALMNMIFATTLQGSYDSENSTADRLRESQIYFKRARALMANRLLSLCTMESCKRKLEKQKLISVHVILLMCEFLCGTRKSTLCWNMLGVAVRQAHILGLNVHGDEQLYSPESAESRTRTWCFCVTLDK